MSYHIRNTATGEVRMNDRRFDYANKTYVGMSENVRIYKTVQDPQPVEYDSRIHNLKRAEPIWSDDLVPDEENEVYAYVIGWELTQKSDEEILEELKQAYINHKEEHYPSHLRERDKDKRDDILFRLLTGAEVSAEEQAEQLTIGDWQKQISAEYDNQKAAFINDGTMPSFEFTPR